MPKVTYKWLREFRKEHRISLRLPNKRWKVPRPVFLERIRITWLNVIRLRYWLLLVTGQEPESIDNFDQKPLHVNESGSKYQKTLAFVGGEVELKELHSATRERWTVTRLPRVTRPVPLLVTILWNLCSKETVFYPLPTTGPASPAAHRPRAAPQPPAPAEELRAAHQ